MWKGNDVRHLGYFEDEAEAAHAYDRAVLELRGPDAATNFAPEFYAGVSYPGQQAAEAAAANGQPGDDNAPEDDGEQPDSLFLGRELGRRGRPAGRCAARVMMCCTEGGNCRPRVAMKELSLVNTGNMGRYAVWV